MKFQVEVVACGICFQRITNSCAMEEAERSTSLLVINKHNGTEQIHKRTLTLQETQEFLDYLLF